MPAQATIDISARITGYQTSLNQLRQAINQLDPGSSIRKSLQTAFKSTESYINKLAKTPVVNVGSDKQLQSLINTLDKASSMVSGISSQLREVRFDDLNADILKDALDDINKKLSETTDKLNQATNGPQLSTLASKVKNLDTVFNGLGKNINDLGAIEGVNILNDALEESKERAEQAKAALDDVQKRINAWKPPQDTTGLFGSKSGDKGTKLLKELDSSEVFKNIDFDKAGFSQQAIQKLKNNLTEQLKASLQSDYLKQGVSQNIQKALDSAFNQGLNAGNLKDRVGKFADDIRTMLGKKASEMGDVYNMIFGGDVGSKAGGAKVADNLLRQITIEMNAGAERLRQIIEVVSNANLAEDKPLIKLVEEGQFENVKQQLTAILQTAKQAYVEMRQLPTGLSDERTQAQERLAAANNDVKNISAVQQQIINTQEYQQAITKIQQLENQIIELRTALSELQAQKVDTVHQTADDVDKAGQSFKITAEQAEQYRNKLDEIQEKEKLLGKIQGVVERWFSIYTAVRLVSNAVRSMISTVEELDKTITNIAIVTNMSQNDLWQQMPIYTKTAREFAASISGVYEVSQLYYQQGLQTADVMKLTEQTLKMARISGLDYAESTDYMTNALRSFKMQMQDAQRIVDVYSAVAASSATNVEELAEAMSKTASSAEAVGSSFENTTAMMAVMIEATRQAPENIGSALKSIISRYGELKVNPATLVDSEGQELSLNKVDTALQSVGISIHDTAGQFRDFDDVIMDLAKSWDTIDKNTQRYIATVMAGNRQQSRFLALVSSYQRLKEEAEIAANSQNAAQLQYLKTLDSIEAKQQQLQTSMQSLYTSTGIQNFYKTLIDLANGVIQSFTSMPTIFNLPIPAILKFGTTFYSLAKIVTTVFNAIKADISLQTSQLNEERVNAERETQTRITNEARKGAQDRKNINRNEVDQTNNIRSARTDSDNLNKSIRTAQLIASSVGVLGNLLSTSPIASNEVKAAGTILGGAGNLAGIGMSIGTAIAPGIGTMVGGIAGAVTGALSGLPEAIDLIVETAEEKVERFNQQITDANNKKLISENEFKTLTDYQKRMDSLNESAKEGNDVKAQQVALNAEIAASYPELIKGIDEQGNIIVDLTNKYKELKKNKQAAYAKDIIESGKQQLTAASDMDWIWKQLGVSQQQVNKSNDTTTNLAGSILNNSKVADYMAQVSSLNATKETKGRDILSILGYNKGQNYLDIDTNIKQIIDKLKSADMFIDDIYADNGQVMVRYFAEALYEYLSSHPDQTVGKVIESLQQSDTTNQLVNQSQKIKTYKENFITGIITSSIAQLRQSYDAIFDQNNQVTGLAGIYMNKNLQNNFKDYRANNSDSVDKQWQDWSNNKFSQVYQSAYQIITDEGQSKLFQQLQKYYDDLDNITAKEIDQLTFNWGTKDAKGVYFNKAFETFINQYNTIKDDIDKQFEEVVTDLFGSYQNFTLGFKKRIIALSQTADLAYFLNSQQDNDESEISEALTILEQNSLDTIAGLETALAQYVKNKGLEVGSNQYKADPFIKAIQEMQAHLKINFNTEYETLTESYTKSLKEFDKAIKNATSGMDFEDAVKLAGQLNKSLADFTFKDGKFFFNDIEAIKQQFMGNDGLKAALQKQVEAAEVIFQNGQILQKYTQEYTQDAWKQVDDDVEKYYDTVQAFIKNNQYTHDESGWKKYIADLQKNLNELDQASSYVARSAYITSGDIDKFIKSFKDSQGNLKYQYIDSDELRAQLFEGTISPDFEDYKQQLLEYYKNGAQVVYDTAVKMLSGEESVASIIVTDANKQLLATLKSYQTVPSFWKTDGSTTIDITYEEVIQNFNAVMSNALTQQGIGWKVRIDNAAKIWNARFGNNSYDSISSAIKSFQEMDFATWATLPLSLQELADLNTVTGKFVLNINEAAKVLNTDYLKNLGWDNKQINELQATIHKSQREKSLKTIATDIVKNRESLTEENISSIATALNQTYDEVIATLQLQRNEDGTYRMNMNSILQLMEQKKGQLDTVLAQMIAEEIDNIIGNVSNIASDQGKGTTKFADMQKAVTRAQEAGFKVETVNDLYEWDETVRGYVLKSEGLFIELAQARMELESLGQNQQQARDLLQHQIDSIGRELASNVDITKYISSPNNWNQNTEVFKNFKKSLEDLNKYFEATGQAIYNIDIVMSSLRQGGIGAVNITQQIAKLQGIDLSNDDVNKIFRAKVDYILEANDQLTATAGEIISQDAGNFLNAMQSGAQLKRLENGSYLVIKSAEDLTKAYLNIYDELVKSGQATVEQLNVAAARYFYAQAKTSKLDALNDIANAAEVTYDELADLFINAGWTMSTSIFKDLEGVIENLGNGKARILNFSAFADALGIDKSTDEYFKALQNFNDSLIDSWNDTRNHVAEQIEDLSKAGPSDLINVTQLQKNLGDKFTEIFSKYGTIVSDGVFQITQATNLPALIKEITTKSTKAGKLLTDEVKNLIDVVNQLYKDMADTIVDGMKGGLSNTDANYLKTQASSNFGLDINFTQSYQGLKLSTDQAIKLYNELKKVDSVSAHLVFEELTEQLTKSGEALESMSHAMAEIKRLEAQGTKQAKERAKVYREIADMQLNNPDAYDFMGNALPDYLKGPENYWNSLGKAFKALNEAAKPPKEGALGQGNYLDVTDFYNIVNEFNNLAQLGGKIEFLGMKLDGSLESASALIQKGMNTLTNIDGQGVKIDLSKIGASFTGGAEGMAKGVDQGIKEMAKSQIKMLDGMIQLLETVVAMEGLKDVADDTGDENVIDLTDIFPKIEVNPEDFTVNEKIISWIDKLFASDNQDLQKALTNVKFGTKTLKQILTDLKNGSIQSKQEAEQAQQALNALYQMYLSGDYSLQNLIGSIKQVLGSSGYEGQVQVGDTKLYISQGFVLEHGEQGWQVPGAGSFTNVNDALSAYRMQTVEGAKNAKTKGGVTTAELVIGSETVDVVTTKDSLTYLVGNKKCKTYNEAAHEAYNLYLSQAQERERAGSGEDILTQSEWRVQNNVILESSVSIENPEQVKNATHKQIQELAQALVSGEDIEAKAQAVGINVKIQGDITQADFQKIASAAGIDTKTLALSLATEVVGDNAENVKKILQNQPLSAEVKLTLSEQSDDFFKGQSDTAKKQISSIQVTPASQPLPVNGLDAIWANLPKEKEEQLYALIDQIIASPSNEFNKDDFKQDVEEFLAGNLTEQDMKAKYGQPIVALINSIKGQQGDTLDTSEVVKAIVAIVQSCQSNNLFTAPIPQIATVLFNKLQADTIDKQGFSHEEFKSSIQQLVDGNVTAEDFITENGYTAFALIDTIMGKNAGFLDSSDIAVFVDNLIALQDQQGLFTGIATVTALFETLVGQAGEPEYSNARNVALGVLLSASESGDFTGAAAVTALFESINGVYESGQLFVCDESVANAITKILEDAKANKNFEGVATVSAAFTSLQGIASSAPTLAATVSNAVAATILNAAESGKFEDTAEVTAVLNKLKATIDKVTISKDFETKIGQCIAKGDYDTPKTVCAILDTLSAAYPDNDINKVSISSEVADKVLEVVTTNKQLFTSSEGQKVIAQLESLVAQDKIGKLSGDQKQKVLDIITGIINGNADLFTASHQLEVVIDDVEVKDPEKAFRDLRNKLYLDREKDLYDTRLYLDNKQKNPNLHASKISNEQKAYLVYLQDRLSRQQALSKVDKEILQSYHKNLQSSTLRKENQQLEEFYQKINQILEQNKLIEADQQEKVNAFSEAFQGLDPTKLQECATAMGELAENAQKVKDVPWAELVSGVNSINNIETPDEDLATASTIMRTVQASLSIVAATGDTVAAEVISPDPIQRTVKLLADVEDIRKKLQALQQFTINLNGGVESHQENDTTSAVMNADSNKNQKSDADRSKEMVAAIKQAVNEAKGLFSELTSILNTLKQTSDTTTEGMEALGTSIDGIPTDKDQAVSSLATAISNIPAVGYRVRELNRQLDKLADKTIGIHFDISFKNSSEMAEVKGTVDGQQMVENIPTRISLAKGNAYASGKTLMGELGPELVVSNGRYFIVGQGGAQMVSLPKDAIVFNHIQTQNLLKKQRYGGRGKPVTNQRNAVAFVKGTGPAMASASAALAALKQIRAMWQSMLNASLKDLGSLAGQEAGKASKSKSGSGGKDSSDNVIAQTKAVIEEIERWYNLVRQIDKLQKDITYQQNLQAQIMSDRVANGKALYRSYKEEINYLDQQIIKNQQLADLQKSWYDRKRNELVESDFGKIFTYNENGQLQYRHGTNLGLDVLQQLTRRDIYGQTLGAAQNASTQVGYLQSIGFDIDKLRYNADGSQINITDEKYENDPQQYYVDIMQNYWDTLDSWKDQLDSIYDSYQDQLNNVLTNETKRNQMLQKIVDNQLSVEQDIVKAIESREQKIIDELQEERDALEKSNRDFLDGLSDQLNQEKQMYKNQQSEKELTKLRRQLSILQRSGGSATQIRTLQEQIAAKQQDQYFTAQEQQIAAIQRASDLQIARMDSQIELMTKTLEYQKENGLLWEEVYQIMNSTPQQIRQFIIENTPDFQSASALDVAQKIRDIDLRINEWIGYRDDQNAPAMTGDAYYDWDSYVAARKQIYGNRINDATFDSAKGEFDRILNATGDINAAGAAVDTFLSTVLGKIPPKQIIDTTVETITDTIKDADDIKPTTTPVKKPNYNDYNNYDYNRSNITKTSTTKTSTSSTSSSDKKTFTFGAYQTEQQKSLMANMDRLQSQIQLAHHYGGTASNNAKVAELEKQFNLSYAALIPQNRKKYKVYENGGLVNYTGLAQVDGTPQRPEAFLNAEQTELLRNHLFGRSDSLLSLAQQLVQQLHGASYSSSTLHQEENNGINIQKVDVNVNVKQIANDYDVRSIGNTVMDEMLKIARKSGTRGLSRR